MGLFRRKAGASGEIRAPDSVPALESPGEAQAPVEFVGVAVSSLSDPRHGFSPYEFQTDAGAWVRLGDMSFVALEFRPLERVLTLRFLDGDPLGLPTNEAKSTLAVFRFSGVRILQWEDDLTPPDVPMQHRGQVEDFDYVPDRRVFCIDTIDTRLAFLARRLEVKVQPAATDFTNRMQT